MRRRLYPLLPDETWPPDDELLSRRDLAKLLGVAEETVKNWDRAGLMPPRVPAPPEGILKGSPRVLWRGSDLREWTPRMVGVIFQRPPKPRGRRMEWVQERGWVELPPPLSPPSVDPAPVPASVKRLRRSSKVLGRNLALLTRLEGQLSALPPQPLPVERPQPQSPRREEPEPVPFASNVGRPQTRSARYW
jgi:hypothetical protein